MLSWTLKGKGGGKSKLFNSCVNIFVCLKLMRTRTMFARDNYVAILYLLAERAVYFSFFGTRC